MHKSKGREHARAPSLGVIVREPSSRRRRAVARRDLKAEQVAIECERPIKISYSEVYVPD